MNKAERQTAQASLRSEKAVLKEIEQVFTQAKQDCTDAIRALNARTDMQNLESIVYQTQYQQAISNQIDGILDALHTQDFNTIAQYLTECYENGYIGAMYDLASQGVPITTPIDQRQVVKAIQTDSKLSKNLYDSLGEDIGTLKASVSSELSRGIASGKSWLDIAENIAGGMNNPFDTAIYYSERIARTEGHRVQEAAQMNAIQEAKDEGADVVKQWDATLDDRTRPEHQELDGQIREIDEPFEVDGYSAMYPGDFGVPEMDINCRCVVTQRAKWALTEGELQTLKDRANYYGLDKTKDFEEYKEKFLKMENE